MHGIAKADLREVIGTIVRAMGSTRVHGRLAKRLRAGA
jgi:hypothetical protein